MFWRLASFCPRNISSSDPCAVACIFALEVAFCKWNMCGQAALKFQLSTSDFCPFKFSGCESWQLLVMSVYLEYILARLTGFLCHVCFWVSRSLKKRFTVSKRDFTLTFLFPRKKGIITSCQPYENIDLRDKNSAIRANSATKSLNQYVLLLNVD